MTADLPQLASLSGAEYVGILIVIGAVLALGYWWGRATGFQLGRWTGWREAQAGRLDELDDDHDIGPVRPEPVRPAPFDYELEEHHA